MDEKLKQLRKMLGEVMDLQYTAAVLGWDQQTYMPPGGTVGRSWGAFIGIKIRTGWRYRLGRGLLGETNIP
jgi:hypothetical protein